MKEIGRVFYPDHEERMALALNKQKNLGRSSLANTTNKPGPIG